MGIPIFPGTAGLNFKIGHAFNQVGKFTIAIIPGIEIGLLFYDEHAHVAEEYPAVVAGQVIDAILDEPDQSGRDPGDGFALGSGRLLRNGRRRWRNGGWDWRNGRRRFGLCL